MITAAMPQFRGFLTDFNQTKKMEDTKTFSPPPPPVGGVELQRERQSLNLQQIVAEGLEAHARTWLFFIL